MEEILVFCLLVFFFFGGEVSDFGSLVQDTPMCKQKTGNCFNTALLFVSLCISEKYNSYLK